MYCVRGWKTTTVVSVFHPSKSQIRHTCQDVDICCSPPPPLHPRTTHARGYECNRNANSKLNLEIEEEVSAFTARTSRQPTDDEFLGLENAVRELRAKYVKRGGSGGGSGGATGSRGSRRSNSPRGSAASGGGGCTRGSSGMVSEFDTARQSESQRKDKASPKRSIALCEYLSLVLLGALACSTFPISIPMAWVVTTDSSPRLASNNADNTLPVSVCRFSK